MKSTFLDYLNSLTKEELVSFIYKPFYKHQEYPAISKRKIALRLSYDGRNYRGVQHHKHLRSVYDCLQNAINVLEIGSDIVFCGRTDAGVSAINMIVSLAINSRFENPNRGYRRTEEDKKEYPYDVILNMMLPEDIRVTGWAPVPDNFNARFDCIQREYKYFFILNDMDLNKMNEAVEKIKNMDDFYLLSTHSNPKAVYKRKLDDIRIIKDNDTVSDDLYYLNIKASGFLHNMVRKIFWVIKMCGKGGDFKLNNVEIADSKPLVFVGAKFKENLEFGGNKYNKELFRKEYENDKIKMAISKLRLSYFI